LSSPALLDTVKEFLMPDVLVENAAFVDSMTLEDEGDAFIRNVGSY